MSGKHPIIVEGPDGGGKTHLALNLAEKLGLQYRRPDPALLSSATGPGGIGLVDWWDEQLAQTDAYLSHGIYDRCFYISDPIYQQAQPLRELLVPSEHLAEGIMRLWQVEPVFIFCLPSFEVQLQNVKRSERDRLAGVDDNALEKISNAYWACYAMWDNSLPDQTLVYDYANPGAYNHLLTRLATLGYEEA